MTAVMTLGVELEFRTAQQIGVSFPKRTVELIVMPYETETLVEYRGRMIREIVARGAFDGINNRPQRVTANRDHDETRICGKAVAFHPSRNEGLVAEIRMSKTPLGEETLELCNDGILDASAGFLPLTDGKTGALMETWTGKEQRRLEKVWLGHVALTPNPAYQDAKVLAVRSEGLTEPQGTIPVTGTPLLEQARALRLRDEYDRLSR